MNIVFFEIEDWEKALFQQALAGYPLSFFPEPLGPSQGHLLSETEILSPFIYSKLTVDVLSELPKLKVIVTRSTGVDHIDRTYCRAHGITVCNVPAYGVDTIAEHTFALILALSRKIIPAVEHTRRGNFTLDGLRGFELAGKTLGIVGLGRIGKRVAELALSFKMHVIASTRTLKPDLEEESGIVQVDLSTLLTQSDIVSLHAPLTPETRYLINKTNITLMKKNSILINTARGAIVESEAILLALEQGILAGAGLDVLEQECALKEERELLTKEFLKTCDLKTQLLNHVLLTKENVIITPHNAFNSQEALEEIVQTTLQNITSYISGKPENTM